MGGASSGTSNAAGADGLAAEDSTDGGGQFLSSAECLVGSWEIDKPSYLELFGAGAEGLGGSLSLEGVATVDITQTTLTSTYTDWTVTGQSPQGEMTLVMNGVETSGWSVSSDDVLTTTNAQSTVVSTLTVSAAGQQMMVPVGDDVDPMDLTNFTVACEPDRATFSAPEGFLVLVRK
jgi:hypothetical protein